VVLVTLSFCTHIATVALSTNIYFDQKWESSAVVRAIQRNEHFDNLSVSKVNYISDYCFLVHTVYSNGEVFIIWEQSKTSQKEHMTQWVSNSMAIQTHTGACGHSAFLENECVYSDEIHSYRHEALSMSTRQWTVSETYFATHLCIYHKWIISMFEWSVIVITMGDKLLYILYLV
jgi:hypothetical protein